MDLRKEDEVASKDAIDIIREATDLFQLLKDLFDYFAGIEEKDDD